jgi:hypothetical protein
MHTLSTLEVLKVHLQSFANPYVAAFVFVVLAYEIASRVCLGFEGRKRAD